MTELKNELCRALLYVYFHCSSDDIWSFFTEGLQYNDEACVLSCAFEVSQVSFEGVHRNPIEQKSFMRMLHREYSRYFWKFGYTVAAGVLVSLKT